MKTLNQKNVLAFNKSALVELNNGQLRNIDSGLTPGLAIAGVVIGVAGLYLAVTLYVHENYHPDQG